jgi:hypothetical protein
MEKSVRLIVFGVVGLVVLILLAMLLFSPSKPAVRVPATATDESKALEYTDPAFRAQKAHRRLGTDELQVAFFLHNKETRNLELNCLVRVYDGPYSVLAHKWSGPTVVEPQDIVEERVVFGITDVRKSFDFWDLERCESATDT